MARTPHPCHCSPTCESTTLRAFAPGHDAKMATRIARMVVAGSLDLEQGKDAILQAGGSIALVRKMVDRVGRAPVAWTRVTDVSVFSERDHLVVQYYAKRAERGLAPWVLARLDFMGDEPYDAPEFYADRKQRHLALGEREARHYYVPHAFWSVEDAVTWQADKCQDKSRSGLEHFHVWYAKGVQLPADEPTEWDPTK
jgi:hypothetical protein